MVRTSTWLFAFVFVYGLASSAQADTPARHRYAPGTKLGDSHVMVITPTEGFTQHAGSVSGIIYANRCTGGCMVTGGIVNDAHNHTSTMVRPGPNTLTEFQNDAGQTGAMADDEWNQVVQCLKEVYSPYNITVTDQQPAPNVNWTELMIAGQPTDLGFDNMVLGIAPAHVDCDAHDNAISFSFANHEPAQQRLYGICWTAAQESAHNFGLDHEFQFSDGTSACNDPMTYSYDCLGEKFFRNKGALCGENAVRPCVCPNPQQNSHQKLLSIFGAGTIITPHPTVSIVFPAANSTIANGQAVQAKSFSQRGVAKVELWLNNHKWAEVKGAPFGVNGQDETTYALNVPNTVPNSVIDVVAKSYDDLDLETDSATITVTKGGPCATADTCLKGQKCDAGKCYWDPATGEIGATCTYNEFCLDGLCAGTDTDQICTKSCIIGSTDACPTGFDCIDAGGGTGICFPPDTGGCCSVDHESSHAIWVHGSLGAVVIGLLLRRRRRRR